jgi:hypothetical protein
MIPTQATQEQAMQERRPTWLRVATTLSVLWSALMLGLVANAVLGAPSFVAAATAPCSQFLVPLAAPVEQALQRIDSRLFLPVVRWQDTRSREDITPFRRGEQALSCADIERRAALFLASARAGAITPKISVHRRRLAALVGLPCCVFVIGSYLMLGRSSAQRVRSPRSGHAP